MADNSTVQSPTPQTVPTVASPELALLAVNGLRAELNIKFDSIHATLNAMEKAVTLQHDDLVRVPTEVQKTTSGLRELVETKIDNLANVSEERFRSIQTQFTLLKQATEQLDNANKTAIAAALQAQKESAGETQKTSQAAIAKSEASTSEAIRALTTTFGAATTAQADRINDLKSRMDRGEGKTSVTDPAVGAALTELSQGIKSLAKSPNGIDNGTRDTWLIALAAVGVVSALIAITFAIFSNTGRIQSKITDASHTHTYQTVQHEQSVPVAPIMKFLVLTKPGGNPVPFSEPSDTLDECIQETNEMLRRAANAAEPGRVQAGCVVTIEQDASRS